MNQMHMIRDENGDAVGEISTWSAIRLTQQANGYFDEGRGHNRRFVFMSSCAWGSEDCKIIIHRNYTLSF